MPTELCEHKRPGPIFIEDFHGNTHEVVLTPGDILFYESTKCFHGRPRRLNGSWYSSLFVHCKCSLNVASLTGTNGLLLNSHRNIVFFSPDYPSKDWYDLNHELEAHYAVPPQWAEDPPLPKKQMRLEMVGTSMRHPDCDDGWCYTKDAVKWGGPGIENYWITPTQEKIPFHPKVHDEL